MHNLEKKIIGDQKGVQYLVQLLCSLLFYFFGFSALNKTETELKEELSKAQLYFPELDITKPTKEMLVCQTMGYIQCLISYIDKGEF